MLVLVPGHAELLRRKGRHKDQSRQRIHDRRGRRRRCAAWLSSSGGLLEIGPQEVSRAFPQIFAFTFRIGPTGAFGTSTEAPPGGPAAVSSAWSILQEMRRDSGRVVALRTQIGPAGSLGLGALISEVRDPEAARMSSKMRVALAVFLGLLLVLLTSTAFVWPDHTVAWATVLEAGILAVAALFAWSQLAETRELRLAQTRPYVVAYIHPNPIAHTILDLVIANVGKTVARSIRLSVTPPLSDASGPAASFPGSHWAAFDSGIPTLAPGQQLSCLWAQSTTVLAENATAPKHHSVTITYAGDPPSRRTYSDEYALDVGAFFGLMRVAAKTQDDEVRALEAIRDVLGRWTESDGVRTYTEGLVEHRDRRDEEIRTLLKRPESEGGSTSDPEKSEP